MPGAISSRPSGGDSPPPPFTPIEDSDLVSAWRQFAYSPRYDVWEAGDHYGQVWENAWKQVFAIFETRNGNWFRRSWEDIVSRFYDIVMWVERYIEIEETCAPGVNPMSEFNRVWGIDFQFGPCCDLVRDLSDRTLRYSGVNPHARLR